MIIVMKPGSLKEEVDEVIQRVAELGYTPHPIFGVKRTVVAAVGDKDKTPLTQLETMAGVEAVIPILQPYKLVSREVHPEPSVLDIGGAKIGAEKIAMVAGPCSIEDFDQIMECAKAVKAMGGEFLRGGAFKPRTSPYDFRASRLRAWNCCGRPRRRRVCRSSRRS